MVLVRSNYLLYDSDDIIGKCKECGGDIINYPVLARHLALSESHYQEFLAGLWRVGLCLEGSKVQIVESAKL